MCKIQCENILKRPIWQTGPLKMYRNQIYGICFNSKSAYLWTSDTISCTFQHFVDGQPTPDNPDPVIEYSVYHGVVGKKRKTPCKGNQAKNTTRNDGFKSEGKTRKVPKRKSSTKKKTEAIAKNPRRSYKETAVSKSNSSNAPEPTPVAFLPSKSDSGKYDMGVCIIWIVYFCYA